MRQASGNGSGDGASASSPSTQPSEFPWGLVLGAAIIGGGLWWLHSKEQQRIEDEKKRLRLEELAEHEKSRRARNLETRVATIAGGFHGSVAAIDNETDLASFLTSWIGQIQPDTNNTLKVYVFSYVFKLEDGLPCIKRAVFVVQMLVKDANPTSEICVFAMYTYEYPFCRQASSNVGRVYIGYLDSSSHYEGSTPYGPYRTIINGYLEYVSALGYKHAHIWSCPPREGKHYIFQKVENSNRTQQDLNSW